MARVLVLLLAALALAGDSSAQGRSDATNIQVDWNGLSVTLPASGGTQVRGFAQLQGKSSRGPVSGLVINGVFGAPRTSLPDWCTGSTVVFMPLTGSGFGGVHFSATGDILEFKSVPDSDTTSTEWGLCWDYVTYHYTGRAIGVVIAGTGALEGASGDVQIRFSGGCLEANCSTPMTPFAQTLVIAIEK